ncbi:MAG: hypothetical protein MK102_00535 [Fuerstiella sp.]|nr:hypothetical protein [Fuerstiella sp.]
MTTNAGVTDAAFIILAFVVPQFAVTAFIILAFVVPQFVVTAFIILAFVVPQFAIPTFAIPTFAIPTLVDRKFACGRLATVSFRKFKNWRFTTVSITTRFSRQRLQLSLCLGFWTHFRPIDFADDAARRSFFVVTHRTTRLKLQ